MNLILEVANTHGGNTNYVDALINEFSAAFRQESSGKKLGMKFQPFTAVGISCPDFSAHKLYKELEIDYENWISIIDKANKNFEVWLDIFDLFSVQVLKENFEKVVGIKFQSSTLRNYEIRAELGNLDLGDKKVIINCAGLSIDEIQKLALCLEQELRPRELIMQVGYQAYPTTMADSGLHKIQLLQKNTNNQLSFADHEDSSDLNAMILPMMAVSMGCKYIEKHIMHSTLETSYDYHSSFKIDQIIELLRIYSCYADAMTASFIVSSEADYLQKSYQKPVAKTNLKKGQAVNLVRDLSYKRTDKKSISINDLEKLIRNDCLTSRDIVIGQVITREDFD
jgi:N,N'-diacetyllegionaminate synthase